ncbi:MAG: DUF3078 domain-containing protein [Candidatus Krumholzibacteriota bacterium]|nr:DUF3078 domain-containing protein [Candidatus Krumholzibacteriota bacterium]
MKITKLLILPVAICLIASGAAAQETWKLLLDTDLTMTQSYYSDSWSGTEVGNLSWVWNINSLAQKQLHEKINNRNTLKLKFGQTHTQDETTGDWKKPAKSNDLIDFESVFRLTFIQSLDQYVSFRLESQFYDGTDPDKKRYINPIKFTESAGIAKELMKAEDREWLVRLGVATRQYLDRDVLVDPILKKRETQSSYDAGLMFDTDIRVPLDKSITYTSKLTVFQALYYSKKDDLKGLPKEDYWKGIDVRWENNFVANITGNIIVNLYIEFLYDKEIDLRGRFKQTLGLGIGYKFGGGEEEGSG